MYLMEFLWGLNHTNFPNMCPYFWLSVANIIISPVAIPLWALIKVMRRSIESYAAYLVRKEKEEREARILKYKELLLQGIKFKELRLVVNYYDGNHDDLNKRQQKQAKKIYSEFVSNLDMEQLRLYYEQREIILAERKKKNYELWLSKAPEREAEAKREDLAWEHDQIKKARKKRKFLKKQERNKRWEIRWNKWEKFTSPIRPDYATKQRWIGKWTLRIKFIAKLLKYVLWIVLTATALIGIWWLTALDYSTFTWAATFNVLKVIGFCLLVIGIIIGIIFLIIRISEYFKYHPIKLPWLRKILYIFYVFYPLIWVWKGFCWLGRGIRRLWELLMALKSNNCPAIEWE